VRNNEIIAAVAHEPHVSSAADGTFSNPKAYQVDVMGTTSPFLTAVANPRSITPPPGGPPKYIDPYFENTPPGTDCKIVTGKPHKLSGNKGSVWAWALQIP
jgi:hypothetical protein